MNGKIKSRLLDVLMATIAITVGVIINVIGDRWTGVQLHLFSGIDYFTYDWAMSLFLVPFVAGLPVALIYGFGGKLLAFFVPFIVQGYKYLDVFYGYTAIPEGVRLLPLVYWLLVVLIAMELAGVGGLVGEIVVKKTYGRTPSHLRHRLYKKAGSELAPESLPGADSVSSGVEK
ncbi:MAG: hypothetical protein HYX62_04115 [Gammaproteobacteria bacterium]|jgi:hypothetical protein|nr:hypothetical protein [Gammaproteobacteria bacterium]